MTKKIVSFILGCVVFQTAAIVLASDTFHKHPDDQIRIADFEGADYGNWTVTGQAFGSGPAKGTLPGQMEVTGYLGSGLVNSFLGGDSATGTLTSPEFEVQRRYISFLIGGGGFDGKTCIDLLKDQTVVRTAVGPNTQPGGSEQLDWHSWDVSDLKGQKVRIRIVDQAAGGWGHINIDHLIQSDVRRQAVADFKRDFSFNKKYLNFPVKTGAAKRWIRLFVDGQKVREFDIELATEEPDFWVFLEVAEFAGKQGTLEIDRFSSLWTTGFNAVFQDDAFPGQDRLYEEKRRPQFHFTSQRGWLNDTNGMVYYKGQYHLFYQHNPYGWGWGNMTWGHAVSSDMIHWQEWGEALHPDALGTIYSGSTVVDWHNTAGFQAGAEKALVAFYTSAGGNNQWSQGQPFTQSIAYSRDQGRTWTKYAGNPVIGKIADGTRDPKVFRHEPTGNWVMVLWIDGSTLSVFTSADLKDWQKQSDIEGFFECPELFELPVDGDPSKTKWVVYGASGDYKLGQFDGKKFAAETDLIKFEYGNCFYASQTFNDMPASDGRRILMGWGRVDMPQMPFNQMILFPVVLSLRTTADGIRMFVNPVEEIAGLHRQHFSRSNLTVQPGENPLDSIHGELFHIKARLTPRGDGFRFKIRGVDVRYDVSSRRLTCRDKSAPLALDNGKVTLEMLVDRMSIEIFANDGRIYMPIGADLTDHPKALGLTAEGGSVQIEKLDIYELNSIW